MDNAWLEKLAIQEPCAQYCHTIDSQDAEGWAQCFTSDGQSSAKFPGSSSNGMKLSSNTLAYQCVARLSAWSGEPQASLGPRVTA